MDQGAPSGPGVDVIHVYAVSNAGAGPAQCVGAGVYGGGRPDVAAYLGHSQFTPSGYGLSVVGLAGGQLSDRRVCPQHGKRAVACQQRLRDGVLRLAC